MPTIQLENCIKCMKCVKDCPSDAIDIEQGTINDTCIHCGHCVAICPESTIFPDGETVTKLETGTVSASDFQQFSAGVRTCRSYLQKEVDEKLLDELVENMKNYPSASNARPIEVTIIKTKEQVQKLNHQTAQKLIKTIGMITSPVLMPILRILAPKIGVDKLNNYKKQFIARQSPESSQICHHAPVVMLFHAPKTKYGMASADANIWATYTSLHANSLGMGTCFNGFIVNAMERSKSMRNAFKIPSNQMVYASLLIGHPKVKYINEPGRSAPHLNVI